MHVPLLFCMYMGRTMARRGVGRLHVKSPNPALSKRQATLQVLARADGRQGQIPIIVRGKGNIKPDI